jgi:hypothetical protein
MIGYVLLVAIATAVAYAFLQHVGIRTLIRNAVGDLEMPIRKSFGLYSQRLNGFATLILLPYIIASNGGFVAQAIGYLPEAYRIILAPLGGFLAFCLVSWARLRIQPPKP